MRLGVIAYDQRERCSIAEIPGSGTPEDDIFVGRGDLCRATFVPPFGPFEAQDRRLRMAAAPGRMGAWVGALLPEAGV